MNNFKSQAFLVVQFLLLQVWSHAIPAEGLYFIVRDDFLGSSFEKINLFAANYANINTSIPTQSGNTASVSYTFSDFFIDTRLTNSSLSEKAKNNLQLEIHDFSFLFQWNYEMRANKWPHPKEHGFIQVFTTGEPAQLVVDLDLDLSKNNLSFVSGKVSLTDPNHIDTRVQCLSGLCLIPVDDIAQGISEQFASTFDKALFTGIANGFQKYQIPLDYPFPQFNLSLKLNGGYSVEKKNFVLFADGLFSPANDHHKTPPFKPHITPPSTAFDKPTEPVQVIFTDYTLRTALWAASQGGPLNVSLTNKDLPPNFPLGLDNDDPLLLALAPGLWDFPTQNLSVNVYLYETVKATLGPLEKIDMILQVGLDFILDKEKKSAFTLLLKIGLESAVVVQKDNKILVNSSWIQTDISLSLLYSTVGAIHSSVLNQVLPTALSYFPPPSYSFQLSIPSGFTAPKGLALHSKQSYWTIGFPELKWDFEPSGVKCSGEPLGYCPQKTTCCQDFCCILPHGVCCENNTCCQEGCQCVPNGCLCQ